MKNSEEQQELVTKNFFLKEMKKRDVKIADIKRDIKALWQQSLKQEEHRENDKEELTARMKKDKDDLMNKLDFIVGELQTLREENIVGAYHTRELRKQVDTHERILQKLK